MADPAVPPPLPTPALPIPVQPLAEPEYGNQYDPNDYNNARRRPGIITAIAIISITVGGLGLFGGGISLLYGGLFYIVAKTSALVNASAHTALAAAAAAQPQTVADDAVVDSNGDPIVTKRGLDLPNRQIIVNILASQRPLNIQRQRQLHALLAKAGQDMFQNTGRVLISADIRREVTESGQLPSPSDSDSNAGPDYFVISTGRIEVSNDRALFEPSDHSQETVRVAAPLPATQALGTSMEIAANGISRRDIQSVIRMVSRQTGNRITSLQRRSLVSEFSSKGGLLLPPSGGMPLQAQVVTSIVQPDGSILVLTPHGRIQISSTGIVQSRIVYGVATTSPATGNAFSVTGSRSPISAGAAIMVLVEGALSILLSIYLLVIGILTLRQTPHGRRLHIIFALLKIPLAIVSGIGWCWFVGDFISSLPAGAGNSPLGSFRAGLFACVTGVAIIYPIGLLITFSTSSVKQYYDSGVA